MFRGLYIGLLSAIAVFGQLYAQAQFEETTIDAGNLGMNVTNSGTIGRPDVRNDPTGPPSMEYPRNSGIEHLFEAGIWIGAKKDGQTAVSTASIDDATGYSTGKAGFEFTPMAPLKQRSSLTSSEHFSTDAVSHQDVLIEMTDRFTTAGGDPIAQHDFPLNADVSVETYAWNFSFADFFIIFNFEITNNSTSNWDSVYMGMWSDLIVRNVNVATDGGAAFFSKGGGGFIDSFQSIYAFDVTGDPGYTGSYGASQFLGILWRDQFFHPSNADAFINSGQPEPKVHGNFWTFRSFDGTQYGSPANDVERLEKMKGGHNFEDPSVVEFLQNPGNRVQLLSAGPLVEVAPGESFNFVTAFVGARQIETGGTTGPTMDTEEAREELHEHLGWARRTFNGEDVNENGLLDDGEDLDDDNVLDRYILPEPPATPKLKIIPSANNLEIYWDNAAESSIDPISKKMDFEGYRLYRTNIGDEFSLDQLGSAQLIGQWDIQGNTVGFNNGFDAVALDNDITFEDDTVAYSYKYEMNGLLNGWQYLIIVTAFDQGDEELRLQSLESSFIENAFNITIGTEANNDFENVDVGVYPNPYKINAAWDGSTERTRKIWFYNLPERCEINVYTLAGDIVASLDHEGATYNGSDILWYDNFGGDEEKRVFSGGEHAWDLLSESGQSITQGLYLFSVKDLATDKVQQGKFSVVK